MEVRARGPAGGGYANGASGVMSAPGRLGETFAHPDHPEGQRWPYRTRVKSFVDSMMRAPGTIMHLFPHEVGRHHALASDLLPKLEAAPQPEAPPVPQPKSASKAPSPEPAPAAQPQPEQSEAQPAAGQPEAAT